MLPDDRLLLEPEPDRVLPDDRPELELLEGRLLLDPELDRVLPDDRLLLELLEGRLLLELLDELGL